MSSRVVGMEIVRSSNLAVGQAERADRGSVPAS